MTTEAKNDMVKYWIPTFVFICMLVAYVWSSATKFQIIDSRSMENKEDIDEHKQDTKDALQQINVKLDVIHSKLR